MTDLDTLWRDYHRPIYGYLFKQTRDHDLADDLRSRTFLRAAVAIANGNGANSNERAWMFEVARSALRDHWRAKRHVTFVDFDDLAEKPTPEPSPHDCAESVLVRERLCRVIDRLTDAQAIVMHLRLGGYPFEEIADLLGLTCTTVRVRAARAYVTMRDAMEAA